MVSDSRSRKKRDFGVGKGENNVIEISLGIYAYWKTCLPNLFLVFAPYFTQAVSDRQSWLTLPLVERENRAAWHPGCYFRPIRPPPD